MKKQIISVKKIIMEDWIKVKLEEYAPAYNEAISNYNHFTFVRLRELREAKDPHNLNFSSKISQRALAIIADIAPQNYNKIEQGRINKGNNITLEQAIKLSIIYGCSIDYIATGNEFLKKESNTSSEEDIQQIIDYERKINRVLLNEIDRLKKKE